MSAANGFKRRLIASASVIGFIGALGAPVLAYAADDEGSEVGELVVTATRRAGSVQTVPFNIAAIGEKAIEEQGLSDLSEIAQWTPGVYIGDTGARGAARIVVRGLNASPSAAAEVINNDGGGTVATYVGEIPLYVDLKLNDMQRVEFLLGPQGTLYGAGTLGGAIRYIPNRPKFDRFEGEVRAGLYGYAHSASPSGEIGFTINKPITDTLAFRANVDALGDSGFIDAPFLVNKVGTSLANPDFTNPADVAANLHRKKDVNTEGAVSGRAALRWKPTDKLDANLTYYYQFVRAGDRQISQSRLTSFPVPIGKYEEALRVLEPSNRTNELLALEVTADLGFAELTSATGASRYREHGGRDQTDLLISLEYSYEAFPAFTAFTREEQEDRTLNQEFRLVSKGTGPFSWIGGAFINHKRSSGVSREFTPGYPEFNGGVRPDNLEYISPEVDNITEEAVYGEASYQVTSAWQVTAGARYYNYNLRVHGAFDVPLFNTVFGGAAADAISLNYSDNTQKDNGWLYKINTSYQFNPDILGYATISQGYRVGGSNGIALCPTPLPPGQNVCALSYEQFFQPDKTTNYELGLKTRLFDHRLTLNGAVYYIKWEDVQVESRTVNGALPYTANGKGAETKGIELSFDAAPNDRIDVRGSFSYNQAELTAAAPFLIPYILPPGFAAQTPLDGQKGDRLPGSPETQASLFFAYHYPVKPGYKLDFNLGVHGVSDVLTRTGGRSDSITLPSYVITDAAITLRSDKDWTLSLYANNIFDEFVEVGVRASPAYNQVVSDVNGDPVYARGFYTDVLPPLQVGVRFNKRFGM